MEDGDSCCDDAKDKLAQAWIQSNDMSPAQGQRLRTNLDEMSCDQFRQMLENIDGTGPGTDMAQHLQVVARDKKILDEWDECASGTSMGMKYASADPFEAGWNHVAKANEGGRPMDNGLAVRQRINDILLPDEDTIPDVANLQTDMGNDPCCGEARELWRDGLIEGWGDSTFTNDPEGGQSILEMYDAMSCEEFRQSLENRFDAQGYAALYGRRSLTRGGLNPHSPRSNHSWEDSLANRVMEAWDKCAEARIPPTPEGDMGGEDMGFYASADPFEAGWNSIAKNIAMPDVASLQTDMGNDPCCTEIQEKWSDIFSQIMGDAHYGIEEDPRDSCETTRQELEEWADGRFGEEHTYDYSKDPQTYGDRISQDLQVAAKKLLIEWDRCAETNLPPTPEGDVGDEDMGFYASADPFETAWDIVQKQIGREDFTYRMAVQPHMMSNKFGNMPPELGLRTSGQLPIKEAIRHLENSQSIEDFARTKGWESAEDVGLRLEDFDSEDQFYEAQAEMGVGYDPLDHLANEYQYFRPYHAKDIARRPDGGITDAEILRVNMEGMGHPNEYREGFPPVARETMLEGLDSRLEAGAKVAPVSGGSISALGQGPMIDVNPAFAGLGLGYSTLASLLENTGRLQENYMSAGGLATLQGLGRQLDEAGIGHKLGVAPSVGRPVMNAQQQLNNWQDSNARYPHQGTVQMSIDDGTQLTHQGTPDKLGYITHSINQQLDNEQPSTVLELKAMLEASKRLREHNSNLPPTLNRFPPFSAPSWQDRIAWGE